MPTVTFPSVGFSTVGWSRHDTSRAAPPDNKLTQPPTQSEKTMKVSKQTIIFHFNFLPPRAVCAPFSSRVRYHRRAEYQAQWDCAHQRRSGALKEQKPTFQSPSSHLFLPVLPPSAKTNLQFQTLIYMLSAAPSSSAPAWKACVCVWITNDPL